MKIQPRGTKPPFFCVHAVGGNVFSFVELARRLGTDQPFYGLQSPDLSSMAYTISEMASSYIDAMRQVQGEGPYCIGGWSMGAVVAFEVARQLCARGQTVRLLAMIDAPHPPCGAVVDEADSADLMASFAHDLAGRNLPVPLAEFRRLKPDEQFVQVLGFAREAGALPADAAEAQVAELFEIFQRNLRALTAYRPGIYEGHIDWFHASSSREHPEVPWAKLARGGIKVHPISGDHYSILKSPHVEMLAQELRAALA